MIVRSDLINNKIFIRCFTCRYLQLVLEETSG